MTLQHIEPPVAGPGARVVVLPEQGAGTLHGRVIGVDASGGTRVRLAMGDTITAPPGTLRKVCGECADCRALNDRPRCAWGR